MCPTVCSFHELWVGGVPSSIDLTHKGAELFQSRATFPASLVSTAAMPGHVTRCLVPGSNSDTPLPIA